MTFKSTKIVVTGLVQGVGFRPFIYRLARETGLSGWVRNFSGGVEILVKGRREMVEDFSRRISEESPRASIITSIDVQDIQSEEEPVSSEGEFRIIDSESREEAYTFIPPDMAVCEACLKELRDRADRRYRYPFINCTDCGPRFTIIESLPYDRPNTTMKKFVMCNDCRKEYQDPLDRRYHAQPVACPKCGPRLSLIGRNGEKIEGEDSVATAVKLLENGRIIAVKGLGGYHLMCDATVDASVIELRKRKKRGRKPFAIMAPSMEHIRRYAVVSEKEEQLLTSVQAPVVLLEAKSDPPGQTDMEGMWMQNSSDGSSSGEGKGWKISGMVAPGLDRLGFMLPYTPLHHLILEEFSKPLVCTSGNLSEEPIISDDGEALEKLKDIADFFLVHDRPIHTSVDDSVVRATRFGTMFIRRSRGYSPVPVQLPAGGKTVLACGAELKNTFAVSVGRNAFLSQHIGDFSDLETEEFFEHCLDKILRALSVKLEGIAVDAHPGYLASRFGKMLASRAGLPIAEIQHHHAHAVSVMAEHGLEGDITGVVLDGLGYGVDGSLRGFEIIRANEVEHRTLYALEFMPLPGGDAASRETWRMGLSLLSFLEKDWKKLEALASCMMESGPDNGPGQEKQRMEKVREKFGPVARTIVEDINCPRISSAGRLFDGVAALLGVSFENSYEAEAAMLLEARARKYLRKNPGISVESIIREVAQIPLEFENNYIKLKPFVEWLFEQLNRKPLKTGYDDNRCRLAFLFHVWVAGAVRETVRMALDYYSSNLLSDNSPERVVLSGGTFQNELLLEMTLDLLRSLPVKVFINRVVPPNDGGLALGQVLAGIKKLS